MKILVTGGAGFIGSHTVEACLKQGHEMIVIDDFNNYYSPQIKRQNIAPVLNQIELVEGDIRDPEIIANAFANTQIDTIIHLAARAGVRPSLDDPELYLSTNNRGTFHLLEAAKKNKVPKFIFASSSSVYGVNEKVPFAESDLIAATISPYAATKLFGEQLCSNYAHVYNIRTVCLRFFTVYGPRQRPDLAISKFTRLISEDLPIDRYGDGTTGRDYTYVEDIVQGIMAALKYEGPMFDIFNLGGSEPVLLNDLIAAIEHTLGKKATINELPEQPGDVPRTSADISKARKLLGYNPQTPLSKGIPKFIEWYQQTHASGEPYPKPASVA
ncbi:MAG: SDR family NAD(P)-dependent oxidoreductase [Verrucomicrobiota bacterium]